MQRRGSRPVPTSPARTSQKCLCSLVMHRGIALAITLAQAAEATGRNRSTILRSIRRGMLSASRDQRTQAWMVDPAELFRVFPPVSVLGDAEAAQGNAQAHRADEAAESRVLIARLEAAEARIADKDATIAEQRAALDDLRRRLDSTDEERRRLTMVLADLRDKPDAVSGVAPTTPPRRSWLPWRRRA